MAEVRKFTPTSNAIRDAVAKAMGEPPRPATPGAPTASKPSPATPAGRADVFTSSTHGFTVPVSPKADESAPKKPDESD